MFKNKISVAIIAVVAIVAAAIMAVGIYMSSTPYLHVDEPVTIVEAGTQIIPLSYVSNSGGGNFEQVKVVDDVNTSVPGEYSIYYSAGFFTWNKKIIVQDTLAPELRIDPAYIHDEDKAFNVDDIIFEKFDNTGITELNYKVLSGKLDKPGEAQIEITASDAYGNTTTKTTTISVKDECAPTLILSSHVYTAKVGEKLDFERLVVAAEDKKTEVNVTWEVVDGDLDHAGVSKVDMIATDDEGNETRERITVTITDDEAPTLTLKEVLSTTLGNPLTADEIVAIAKDNDGKPQLDVTIISGNYDEPGEVEVEVTAKDYAGNTTSARTKIIVKNKIFNEYGWDITGREGQPYFVSVNRSTCVVTVYGKDENGNYTKVVKKMLCSVAREGYNTPTGVFKTSERYRWRLLNDGTFGQYAIRIKGSILFHSVPYYSMNEGDLEYPEFNNLGRPASMGCVRLCVKDVLWLYNNCPTGFTTAIFDDPNATDDMPTAPKIDVNDERLRGWDPTDPAEGNPYMTGLNTND